MSWQVLDGGGSSGGGSLNVPSDQIFNSEAERDTYFANNPTKLIEGAQCIIVTNAPAGLYQVYTSNAWEDRSQVIRGPQGEKGDKGDTGEIDTVGLDANTLPVVNGAGDNFENSPLTVDAQGNVSMSGTFTANELKTNIASLNLGDQKKISGLGEGVEIHDISQDRHKFIVTQWLDKDEDTRAFQYKQEEYQLINIQPVFDTTLTNPEFDFTTQLGDQILYGFEVKVNTTQNNCVAQIFRQGQVNPIWEETFNNVQSDTLVLGSPVALDGNTTYMFKITGEFLGEPGGRMYYSIGARLAEKQELLDGSDRVNVDSIQTPNIETGEGLKSEQSGNSVVIELSGNKDVIELDVTLDATREITNAYVGKFLSITQSGNPVAIPMQLTLAAHNSFETGDTIKIGTSDSYVNYYFAVYYTVATGTLKVQYPSKNITMVRTDSGWDVEKDGTYTNVAIVPRVGTVDASQDNPLLTPVSSFAFLEHPGVTHFDNADGTRAVSIDLNAVDTEAFTVDGNETVDLIIGGGINYAYDAVTRESTISIDPTNISLDGFAQLETDVVFSKLSIANDTDPAYVSVLNVTNGGNSELNLVGTTNIRKVDKVTGDATDVIRINGSSGDVDFLTVPKKDGVELASLNEVAAAFPERKIATAITYQQLDSFDYYELSGTSNNATVVEIDSELLSAQTLVDIPVASNLEYRDFTVTNALGATTTKRVYKGERYIVYTNNTSANTSPIFATASSSINRGIGVPEAIEVSGGNSYNQTAAVALFTTVGNDINDVEIQIDSGFLESETIIVVPYDSQVTTKNFDVVQITGQGTTKNIKAGDTWKVRMIVDQAGDNLWFWEKIYTPNSNVVYGLAGRNDIVDEPAVKAFAYAEGMPFHLLLETPNGSRLFHEFPKNKTFRFTPTSSSREFEGSVVISQANQGVAVGDLSLGQYSDIPLYIIEPNVVINRDQRAWVNFPASLTIDVSNGFYAFGTVSGWCGNNNTEGNVGVYVGTSENFRSYNNNIGFVLGNSGLFLLDGFNLRTPNNNTSMAFNIEPGVTHMYRYAFYVDNTGLMTYYIVDLNTGQVSTGTQQCNLGALGNDPKLYISYDRYANNTAAIAIAETHLVVNSVGNAEDRWNWRN